MSRARALLALLAVPAFVLVAAPAGAVTSPPLVKSVSPLRLKIGERLTIRGSGFIEGRRRDTVVFMGPGRRVVWVKANSATTRRISVTLPAKLLPLLSTRNGVQQPTRLRIRVIARKSGPSFTKSSQSPVVSPSSVTGGGPGGSVTETCPGVSNAAADSDGDGLSNGLEASLRLNPCNADSDGDGVRDGYEYQSALDLNRTAGTSAIPWPYPGKRPYPNPLDSSDAGTDYDGDGLTMMDEYQGSKFLGWTNDLAGIPYSDGDQTTGPAQRCGMEVAMSYCDYAIGHAAGTSVPVGTPLTDDQKDADGDGLPNWDELYGRETQAWWTGVYTSENHYTLSYPNLNWLDRDTNGDGRPDGADDTDGDGYTNIQEISRNYADSVFTTLGAYDATNGLNDGPTLPSGEHAYVNPDNPCLPDWLSPTCMRHPPAQNPPAPFDGSVAMTWPSGPPSVGP